MSSRVVFVSNIKGFTLIELLVVISVIGVLSAVAIPQFSQYKNRAYNANTKSDLHHLYLACKAYWLDNASNDQCTVNKVAEETYGLVQTENVDLNVATNTEDEFFATGIHSSTNTCYSINSTGHIEPSCSSGSSNSNSNSNINRTNTKEVTFTVTVDDSNKVVGFEGDRGNNVIGNEEDKRTAGNANRDKESVTKDATTGKEKEFKDIGSNAGQNDRRDVGVVRRLTDFLKQSFGIDF